MFSIAVREVVIHMAGITVKDLMKEQQRRFIRQRKKEEESRVPEHAKANFRRPAYFGMYGNKNDEGRGDR